MTERRRRDVEHGQSHYRIGPSSLDWDGNRLEIRIDEITVPWPSRLKGVVRVYPVAMTDESHVLDADGRHFWWPVAPIARIEVEMEKPSLTFKGEGYFDMNGGSEPLEAGFSTWDWSRAHDDDGAAILYDVIRADGHNHCLGLRFDGKGMTERFEPPQRVSLKRGLWGLSRGIRSDGPAHVQRSCEDSPFYTRSVVEHGLFGKTALSMHESLSLDRFSRPWLKLMLPFRMPRRV
jgi:carotenoid 1,2-hydratase